MINLLRRLRGSDRAEVNDDDSAEERKAIEERHRQLEDEIRVARLVKEQRLRSLGQ